MQPVANHPSTSYSYRVPRFGLHRILFVGAFVELDRLVVVGFLEGKVGNYSFGGRGHHSNFCIPLRLALPHSAASPCAAAPCSCFRIRRRSEQLSSMLWRARGTIVCWAKRSVGALSCPAPPRPNAPPCAAPPRLARSTSVRVFGVDKLRINRIHYVCEDPG